MRYCFIVLLVFLTSMTLRASDNWVRKAKVFDGTDFSDFETIASTSKKMSCANLSLEIERKYKRNVNLCDGENCRSIYLETRRTARTRGYLWSNMDPVYNNVSYGKYPHLYFRLYRKTKTREGGIFDIRTSENLSELYLGYDVAEGKTFLTELRMANGNFDIHCLRKGYETDFYK